MEETCARCGKKLSINEYVQFNKQFKILDRLYIMHFCKECYVIDEEIEDALFE